ncbi:Type I Iterative PKS [Arachnomyces sp. PD_36]|nr:Type I Iterative PKS [Arachnomyces sp. PD_36]
MSTPTNLSDYEKVSIPTGSGTPEGPESLGSPNGAHPTGSVAIIGMGCRLPGSATNPGAFWEMLMRKESANGKIPSARFDVDKFLHQDRNAPGSLTTAGGYFLRDDPTLFEPQLFAINPVEAAGLDPALKKLLEVVYETIESAGIDINQLAGSETGCYVGSFNHDELFAKVRDSRFTEPYTGTSAIAPFLANRISYIFDLHGPRQDPSQNPTCGRSFLTYLYSMTIDTACSASFHALHLACQAIKCGDIESAIVASSNLVWSPDMQIFLDKLGALSSTSQCHAFGADADGYGRADGFVSFFVKDLQAAIRDGDSIQAVIIGTAINSNGRTGGITHPSPASQQSAMRQAYRAAGNLDPKNTAYYECHGTGTAVGDPLELKGIQDYFSPFRSADNPLLFGSVKSNLGHSEPVSGLTGLLKTVLAIKNGIIPPMIAPSTINPKLGLDDTKFKLLSDPHPWPDHNPRRASVATSGFGGANAHVVVEEFKTSADVLASGFHKANGTSPSIESKFLLPFSAHKPESLSANFQAIGEVCNRYSAIDLAYTLGARRSQLLHRGFSIISGQHEKLSLPKDEFHASKRLRTTPPKIGFVFTGQGAQWPQMGKELFQRFSSFRSAVYRMTCTLRDLPDGPSWTLEDIILAPKDQTRVYQAEISQPACTAVQLALVAVLKSFDITPFACLGHSSGEMAAAYAAGLISEDEAIIAAYYRGKSVSNLSREGSMVAVGLGAQASEPFLASLRPKVDIAAINSPESVTVSGDTDTIQALSAALSEKDIFNRVLSTGGKAYHSSHMKEIGEIFETSMRKEAFRRGEPPKRQPTSSFFSSVLGKRIPEGFQVTPSYWRQNLENPVIFSPALSEMVESGVDHIIEIGPHSALAGPIRQIEQSFRAQSKQFPQYSPSLVRNQNAEECMLTLAGTLFNDGLRIIMEEVNRIENPVTLEDESPILLTDLPTYQYAYGPSSHRMNRLEKEFRYPKFPFHRLLGGRVLGGSPRSPAWRNVLDTKQFPEINETKLLGAPSVPVSCLLEMAFTAAQQLALTGDPSSPVPGSLALTNIRLPNVLTLETEKDIVTSFYADSSEESCFLFEISSVQADEATLHCSGQAKIGMVGLESDSPLNSLKKLDTPVAVSSSKWYNALEATGLEYKPLWQTMGQIHFDPLQRVYRCEAGKPLDSFAPQVTLIETCIQLAIVSTAPHGQPREFGLVRPTSIAKVQFATRDTQQFSSPSLTTARCDGPSVDVALHLPNGNPAILLENVLMEMVQDARSPMSDADIALESIWKPDFTTLQQGDVDEIFPSPGFPATEDFSKIHKMSSAMVIQYISEGVRPKSLSETGQNLMEWMESAYKGASDSQIPYAAELVHMKPFARAQLIETLYEEISNESVEAQLVMRMYKNLNGILDGSTSAHDVIISDGLLAKLYTGTPTAIGSMIQLRKIIDLVGHKFPAAKYLEIGGGTRGATREILDVLGAQTGPRRYGEYCFTDVSSYFLSGARDEFHDFRDMQYGTLNIEQLPCEQGFADGYYDVVVAANVLHATSSIEQTLQHTRKLLKPGGKLILVETTIETVWLTIVLGGFSDYWKGRRDGRPSSPFIPVSQWSQILKRSGFTSPQLNLPDYEDPFRTMNVLVSTVTSGPETIERFYPVTSRSLVNGKKPLVSGTLAQKPLTNGLTNGINGHKPNGVVNGSCEAQPIVLVDCLKDALFPDLTIWLTEMGTRSLILASSDDSQRETDNQLELAHIERLRSLGVDVYAMQATLSVAKEKDFAAELDMVTPHVKGVIFRNDVTNARKQSGMATSIVATHQAAQRIFSESLLPEKVFIFTNSEGLLADPHHAEGAAHIAIRDIAESWVGMGALTGLFGTGGKEDAQGHSTTLMSSFDHLVPALTSLFTSNDQSNNTRAKFFVYGMHDMALHTDDTELSSPFRLLRSDERFSVLLQEVQTKAKLQGTGTQGENATSLVTAVARFQSTPPDQANARRTAAVDAIAELLAELLFIPREEVNMEAKLTHSGIDSLVASELRKQLTQHLGINLSTGWLLGGDITPMDIVGVLLGDTNSAN